MAADTPNDALSKLLAGLSWSGERLAREICRVLGEGAVHPTAPYKWLKGHQPRRDEVRQATAFVLSQARGQLIAVGELWPGCAVQDARLIPAIVGMQGPWILAGTLDVAHEPHPITGPRATRCCPVPRWRRPTWVSASWSRRATQAAPLWSVCPTSTPRAA
ncbi:MAG: hypothetical protein ACRDTC_10515 [Pseudonocardiaceae bacterium]